MKGGVFLLGILTGTVLTYLFLTRVWWPDVRLEAAHAEARPMATPGVAPAAMPNDAALSLEAPAGPSLAMGASPPATAPLEGPARGEAALPPDPFPPLESKSLQLPLLETDLTTLLARGLLIPVPGIESKSLRDTFTDDRGGRHHEAIDILAPRGTPVLAVDDGRVERLFSSRFGGLTVYQFDGPREYCYYYAHLDRYAVGLAEGALVRRGDVIGYVGTSGNAPPQTPHLHFAIFRLGADKHWWQGTAIDAYPLWGPPSGG